MFGARVRDLRKAKGWTQGELAQFMTDAGHPMGQTVVTKLESGNRPTTVAEVAALAVLFEVPLVLMFGDPDEVDALLELFALKTRMELHKAERERLNVEARALQARMDEVAEGFKKDLEDYEALNREHPEIAPIKKAAGGSA